MLKVHTRDLGNATVLFLQGQIVNGDTGILRLAFDSLSQINTVLLDLAGVTIIDAHGLGVMLELREQAEKKGTRFKLTNVPTLVNRVLEISRLDSVFQITSRIEYFPSVPHPQRASVRLKSCA